MIQVLPPAVTIALALLCGCTYSVRFRVVDAITREPLAGVNVSQASYPLSYFWSGKPQK